eukprot:992477-Prorocentrum_lima.AAC.1
MNFHPIHGDYLTQGESEAGPGNWLHESECCETNPVDNVHQNKFENLVHFMQQCNWQGPEPVSYTHLTLPTICSV